MSLDKVSEAPSAANVNKKIKIQDLNNQVELKWCPMKSAIAQNSDELNETACREINDTTKDTSNETSNGKAHRTAHSAANGTINDSAKDVGIHSDTTSASSSPEGSCGDVHKQSSISDSESQRHSNSPSSKDSSSVSSDDFKDCRDYSKQSSESVEISESDSTESYKDSSNAKVDKGSNVYLSNSKDDPPVQVNQTPFIQKLYSMLEDHKLNQVISWSPTNDSFFINPAEEFSKILCLYFKHTNPASFVRQLSMYGFHKINQHSRESSRYRCQSEEAASIASNFSWEFKHIDGRFRRNDFSALRSIKRRSSRRTSRDRKVERHVMVLPPAQQAHDGQIANQPSCTVSQNLKDSSAKWYSPAPDASLANSQNQAASAAHVMPSQRLPTPVVSTPLQNQAYHIQGSYAIPIAQPSNGIPSTNGDRKSNCRVSTPASTASADIVTGPIARSVTQSPFSLVDHHGNAVANEHSRMPQLQGSVPPAIHPSTQTNGKSVTNWIQQRSQNYMVYPEMGQCSYNQSNQTQRPQLPHPIHDVASGELISRVLAKQQQLESEISNLQSKVGTLSQSASELGLLVHLLTSSGQNAPTYNAIQNLTSLTSRTDSTLGSSAQDQPKREHSGNGHILN